MIARLIGLGLLLVGGHLAICWRETIPLPGVAECKLLLGAFLVTLGNLMMSGVLESRERRS